MSAYWCCSMCGYPLRGGDPRPGDECDNCGDDVFMCSECASEDICEHLVTPEEPPDDAATGDPTPDPETPQ